LPSPGAVALTVAVEAFGEATHRLLEAGRYATANASRDGLAKDVYFQRNWQRSLFWTGGVATTGIAIRHSPKLCGLILPCLMPERPFAPELARIDSLALVSHGRKGSSWKTF
jgi:hypothetical protein